MEQEVIRAVRFFPGWGRFPKWLTTLLNVFLAITLIYGIIRISATLIELVRKFFCWFFMKRNFYIVLLAVFLGCLAGLIIAQIKGVPILQDCQTWLLDKIQDFRDLIGNNIIG